MRVLVAGATGYLGGFVVRESRSRGHSVRALARSPGKLAALRGELDGIVQGEITRPEMIEAVCDGIDVVFSSVGITRQKDGVTFRDVDYQGNANLLRIARRAGVKRFVYVSVFRGRELRRLDIVDAHEAFVDELEASGIEYAVLRPTGYFSDMGEILEMARKGKVWLFGSGESRANPIHGADLAAGCVDAFQGGAGAVDLGGPEVLTWREIAEMAFRALDRPVRIGRVPAWIARSLVRGTRLFDRHRGELLAFFVTMATTDMVAPTAGSRTLEAHFRELAAG